LKEDIHYPSLHEFHRTLFQLSQQPTVSVQCVICWTIHKNSCKSMLHMLQ